MSYKPLTGMIKEAVFSILTSGQFCDQDTGSSVLDDAIIIDLFGGTGAIAFEGVSRGAKKGIIVESDSASFDLLKKNVRSLGVEDQIEIIRGDATSLPYAPLKCSIAFLDPPFNAGLVIPSVKSLLKREWLAENALIVVRTHTNEKFNLDEFASEVFVRKYNNSFLRIYQVKA